MKTQQWCLYQAKSANALPPGFNESSIKFDGVTLLKNEFQEIVATVSKTDRKSLQV